MDSKALTDLQDVLDQLASDLRGTPMIMKLIDEANKWIEKNDIDLTLAEKTKTKNVKKDKSVNRKSLEKQKRKNRKEKVEQEETEDEKKPSMKTADDVVKRILWDGDLPSDEFIVGYIDRFLGIQEKYFTAFSWEDIASVDYTVLAVPKHRIQYFKYKEVKVWDKTLRMDNVFGSTGSKMTIYDVIEQYHKDRNENHAEFEPQNVNNDNYDSDSDSDDGVTVTIGNERGETSHFDDEQCQDELEDEDKGYGKHCRDKMRPNHFLALRITDEEIKKVVEGIQDQILEHEPMYEQCCMPLNSLHITLCTVGLDTTEQVANACEVLKKIQSELKGMIPKETSVVFKGMENFFNRVLYVKCECPTEFLDMVEHLKLCLRQEGVEIRDNHDFVPHMTIMKVTRTVAKSTGKKYIAPWLYSQSQNIEFGTQIIDNIHLCEMGINREGDGFYISPQKIDI